MGLWERRNKSSDEAPGSILGSVIDAIIMKVNNNSFVRDWDFYFIIEQGPAAFHAIVQRHIRTADYTPPSTTTARPKRDGMKIT